MFSNELFIVLNPQELTEFKRSLYVSVTVVTTAATTCSICRTVRLCTMWLRWALCTVERSTASASIRSTLTISSVYVSIQSKMSLQQDRYGETEKFVMKGFIRCCAYSLFPLSLSLFSLYVCLSLSLSFLSFRTFPPLILLPSHRDKQSQFTTLYIMGVH